VFLSHTLNTSPLKQQAGFTILFTERKKKSAELQNNNNNNRKLSNLCCPHPTTKTLLQIKQSCEKKKLIPEPFSSRSRIPKPKKEKKKII
jgi:hypothetical protein